MCPDDFVAARLNEQLVLPASPQELDLDIPVARDVPRPGESTLQTRRSVPPERYNRRVIERVSETRL